MPCYTYSFDEAMSLVVENYYVGAIHEDPRTGLWTVMLGARGRDDKPTVNAEGKHLPAVLCAAWLLAGAA